MRTRGCQATKWQLKSIQIINCIHFDIMNNSFDNPFTSTGSRSQTCLNDSLTNRTDPVLTKAMMLLTAHWRGRLSVKYQRKFYCLLSHRRKNVIRVWNDMRMCKGWQNFKTLKSISLLSQMAMRSLCVIFIIKFKLICVLTFCWFEQSCNAYAHNYNSFVNSNQANTQ